MALAQPRSIEQLVEDQVRRWNLPRPRPDEERPAPVITVSRQHGAGGAEVARRLCEDLDVDLVDHEIIRRIAVSTRLTERAVEELDEKDHEILAEWLMSLADPRHLDPLGYREHLTHLVRTITRAGGAVIVGRGAHLILSAEDALRVLVVAPFGYRVESIMRREGLSERSARERIAQVDGEREAFLRRHFHAPFADPSLFDLVVNAGDMGVTGAVTAIEAALQRQPASP
jgi:cytidylate kinase